VTAELVVTVTDDLVERIAQRVAEILAERDRRESSSRWLTAQQAADYLQATPQRIYDLRSSGWLSRTGDGSRVLVDRRELDVLLASR